MRTPARASGSRNPWVIRWALARDMSSAYLLHFRMKWAFKTLPSGALLWSSISHTLFWKNDANSAFFLSAFILAGVGAARLNVCAVAIACCVEASRCLLPACLEDFETGVTCAWLCFLLLLLVYDVTLVAPSVMARVCWVLRDPVFA